MQWNDQKCLYALINISYLGQKTQSANQSNIKRRVCNTPQ